MATPEQIDVLEDIFGHLDYPEKVTIVLDPVTRDVTISYPDMDEEWFKELMIAATSNRTNDG